MNETIVKKRTLASRIVRAVLMFQLSAITALALAYALEQWRGERAWRLVVEAHAVTNDSFDIRTTVLPPVPDAENFWATPLLKPIFNYHEVPAIGNEPMHIVWADTNVMARLAKLDLPSPLKGMSTWPKSKMIFEGWKTIFQARPEYRVAVAPSNTAAEIVLAAMHRYDDILDELSAASLRPFAQPPISYTNTSFRWFPGQGYPQAAAVTINLRAQARLATGDREGAVVDLELIERLARCSDRTPAQYSPHMSTGARARQPDILRAGMLQHVWNDSQLGKQQTIFESQMVRPDFTAYFKAERNYVIAALDNLPNGRIAMAHEEDPPYGDLKGQLMTFATGRGWIRQNQVTAAEYFSWLESVASRWRAGGISTKQLATEFPDPLWKNHNPFESAPLTTSLLVPGRPVPYSYLARYLIDGAGPGLVYLRYADMAVAKSRMAAIACALERYRIAQGNYPSTLAELTPTFLREIPLDPCNLQAFHYHPTNDDWFVLYSVGSDGRDDLGTFRDGSGRLLDWPWPGKGEIDHTFM